jgi:hypothetical protein
LERTILALSWVNGAWSLVSKPGYQNLWPVKPFAPGEAWLTGEDSATGLPRLLLYHNGRFTPVYTLPPQDLLYGYGGYQIEMDSPQSAWLTLQTTNAGEAQKRVLGIGRLFNHLALRQWRMDHIGNRTNSSWSNTDSSSESNIEPPTHRYSLEGNVSSYTARATVGR